MSWEDSFTPISSSQGWESNFQPISQQPVADQTQPQPNINLNDPSNIPQAEAAYVLNSANNLPGLNLLKDVGAGIRGIYAGATAPDGKSFGEAYNKEYDSSRANQDALMKAGREQQPGPTSLGQVSGALASMGYLPTPGPTGSMVTDAVAGGGTGLGYGLLGGFGSGSSLDDRLQKSVNQGITGAGFGAAMAPIAGGLTKAVQGISGLIKPSEMPAIQAALENNIPIYKSNVSDSKALDYLSTLSNEIPSILGGTSGRVPSQQEALAEALTRPIGQSSGVLNSNAVDSSLSTSGKTIQNLAAKTDIPYNSDFDSALLKIENEAKGTMTDENYQLLQNKIQSLRDQSTNNVIPGSQYKDFRTGLNNDIQNNSAGPTAVYGANLRKVRDAMDNQAISVMSPEDALAMQRARGIYSNAKDLQSVTDKNPTGDYSFGSLYNKLGDNPNLEGPSLAAQLLKNGTGNSGTAQRQFIIQTAKGLGTAGAGTAALYGDKKYLENDPNALANTLMDVGGAGLGAATIGTANKLMNPQITPSNLNGIQALQPVSKQALALADFLRRAYPAASIIKGEQQ